MSSTMEKDATPELPASGTAHFPRLPPVPRARYLDRDFYKLEIEHIFKKKWLLVGHASEYAQVGSYRLLDVPFAPIVVLRDKAGELRAFLNSCQHRGATVLREKAGCTKFLSCQYHGWVYGLDGKLVSVTNPESFPGLDVNKHSLVSLRCEQWGELVYINFDMDGEPLLDYLAPYVERFPQWNDMSLRVAGRLSSSVECNWKAMVDAFYESYHLPFIHKSTAGSLVEADRIIYELYPNGHGNKISPYFQAEKKDWDAVNADELPTVCDKHGQPAFEDTHHCALTMFPNVDLILTPRAGVGYLNIWPTGVNSCRLDYTLLCEDWGDDTRPGYLDNYLDQMQTLLNEDMANMCSIQRSLQADPNGSVILGGEEVLLYNFHAEIDRLIGAENVPVNLRVPDALKEFVRD